MARRELQDRLAGLDAEVSGYEERLEQAREDHRKSGVALAQAEAEKGEVATAEAKGALSREAARKRFEEAAAKSRRHADEQERLGLLVERYEVELEDARAQLATVEYEVAAEEARSKHTALEKAAERLGGAVATAAKEAVAFKKARDGAAAASARARELAANDIDPPELHSPEWLPPGVQELVSLIEGETAERARERQTAAAAEKGRRERQATETRKLIARYNRTGDPAILEQLDEADVAEARRQHGVVRRQHEPDVQRILDNLRAGRTSPARALDDLRRLSSTTPDDLRDAARREIEALAGRERAGAAA